MPKEAIAGDTVLAFSKADPASNELIKAIVADLESGEGRASGPDGIFGKDMIPPADQMRIKFSVHRYTGCQPTNTDAFA
jgi:hypothetical protein